MKASELVEKLQTLIKTHGDLYCVDTYDDTINEPEFSNDPAPCFVLADRA